MTAEEKEEKKKKRIGLLTYFLMNWNIDQKILIIFSLDVIHSLSKLLY